MKSTYCYLFFSLIFIFAYGNSFAQPVGQLYLQHGSGANAQLAYIDYPAEQYQAIDQVESTDLAASEAYLYAAAGPHQDAVYVYDRATHQLQQSLQNTQAQWLGLWGEKLVVSSRQAPFLRVYDPNQGYQELFSLLDSTVMNGPASDLLVTDDRAYVLLGQKLIVVDLDLEDTLAVIATPPPLGNQNFNTSIVNGKDHVFIQVDYATGAIRSSMLKVNKLTLQVETAFHAEGQASYFPPVTVGDSVFVYQDYSHYDLSEDSFYLQITPAQYFFHVLDYDPLSEAFFNYGGVLVASEIQFQAPNATSQGVAVAGVQHVHFALAGNTSIENDLTHEAHFQLYPNPATDFVQLFSDVNKRPNHIRVLNTKGQVLQTYESYNVAESQQFDVRNLTRGGYFLELQFQDEKVVKPFVKW